MSSLPSVSRSLLGALALVSVLALTACGGGQPEQVGTAGAASASGSAAAPSTGAAGGSAAGGSAAGGGTEDTGGGPAAAGPSPTAAPAAEPAESAGAQEPAELPGTQEPDDGPAEDPAVGGAAAGTAGSRTDRCTTSALDVSAVPAGGAAGSVHVELAVTNTGQRPCTLAGYPGVSFVDATGAALGVPAVRDASVPGTGQVLAHGESAAAALRVSQAGHHAACDVREAAGLRVYPPENTESVVVPFPAQACTGPGIQQLEIQGFGT